MRSSDHAKQPLLFFLPWLLCACLLGALLAIGCHLTTRLPAFAPVLAACIFVFSAGIHHLWWLWKHPQAGQQSLVLTDAAAAALCSLAFLATLFLCGGECRALLGGLSALGLGTLFLSYMMSIISMLVAIEWAFTLYPVLLPRVSSRLGAFVLMLIGIHVLLSLVQWAANALIPGTLVWSLADGFLYTQYPAFDGMALSTQAGALLCTLLIALFSLLRTRRYSAAMPVAVSR